MPKRRTKGEGTLKQTASGKWRVVKRVAGAYLSTSSCNSRKEAIEAGRRLGLSDQPEQTISLVDFAMQQLSGPLASLSPTTWALTESVIGCSLAQHPFAHKPLSLITTADCQSYVNTIMPRLSPSTVRRYFAVLQSLLSRAQTLGLIDANPATTVDLPKIAETQKIVLTKEQATALLDQLPSHRLKLAAILCLHGLRPAEACGVQKQDFDGECLNIRRQVLDVRGRAVMRATTKTRKSRIVPANALLRMMISAAPEGFLLRTAKGNPLSRRNLARDFTRALKGTDFEGVKLYDLRSTCAMLLLEAGADVRTSAEILGHSPAMLAKTYARSRTDLKISAINKIWETA